MRLAVAALVGLSLAGCTSAGWDHSFQFLDTPRPDAPPPPVTARPDPAWCSEAAAAAKSEAAEQGFDAATQQIRADSVLAQCRGRK